MSATEPARVVQLPRAIPSPDLTISTLGPARIDSPMADAVSGRNQVDPHGDLWMAALESTGQPVRFG